MSYFNPKAGQLQLNRLMAAQRAISLAARSGHLHDGAAQYASAVKLLIERMADHQARMLQ